MSVLLAPNLATGGVPGNPPAAESPSRIALVSEDILLQLTLRKTLESLPQSCILESYLKSEEASYFITTAPPTMVLLDDRIGRLELFECLSELRTLYPRSPLIVLGSRPNPVEIFSALRMGAVGYLIAPLDADQLGQALRAAERGWPALCQQAQETIMDWLLSKDLTCWHAALSPGQHQLVPFLFGHHSDKQIAKLLGLPLATVEDLFTSLFKKLTVQTRYQAVLTLLGLVQTYGQASIGRRADVPVRSNTQTSLGSLASVQSGH